MDLAKHKDSHNSEREQLFLSLGKLNIKTHEVKKRPRVLIVLNHGFPTYCRDCSIEKDLSCLVGLNQSLVCFQIEKWLGSDQFPWVFLTAGHSIRLCLFRDHITFHHLYNRWQCSGKRFVSFVITALVFFRLCTA